MRVTNNLIYGQSSSAMANASDRVLTVQDKINKQTNIAKASDNPVGAREVLQYNVSNDKLKQYDSSIKTAVGSLEYEEVTLESLNDLLDEAKTLFIQAQNDVNKQTDIDSIAQQLSIIVRSMADLMNSKSSDGNYIFSGTNSKAPAFAVGSDGRYQWMGNEEQKFVQISEGMQLAVTDSGKALFQDVWTHHTFNAKVENGDVELIAKVKNQGDFDRFMAKYYNPVDASKNNFFLTTKAPDNGSGSMADQITKGAYYGLPGEYVVTDSAGKEMAAGPYNAGQPIFFGGMSFVLRGPPGDKVDITLAKPKRDNVLNQINDSLRVLTNRESSDNARENAFFNATTSISNTQRVLGEAQSLVGARLNTLTHRGDFNSANQLSNSTAQDNVAGLDVAAAVSELSVAEAALTSSQKLFSRINNLSLFNQI